MKNARLIKKHVDVAIKSNPNNYLAWHILGRWNYEISNVSAVERAGAKLFYGGVPHGTLANAIMYFEKARSLEPLFILNYLSLADAYHKNGQIDKAIAILGNVQQIAATTEDDAQHKADAARKIKSWK
ncbi:MAG: tetratricopeptide repeat protein [Chitinophagaceae bacterium]|nr:MAG: tetratricopeptide repeat protein [Chitinophagaceae bacterium]